MDYEEIPKRRRINDTLDHRYDSFFAALLSKSEKPFTKYEIPNSFNIISWNYDLQIEKTYNFYAKANNIKDAGV